MEISRSLFDSLKNLGHAYLNAKGEEVVNPVPLFVDIGPKPLSLKEQIQRLMRVNLSQEAQEQGKETLEESMDFDVDDEFEVDESNTNYTVLTEEAPIKPTKADIDKAFDIKPDPDPELVQDQEPEPALEK